MRDDGVLWRCNAHKSEDHGSDQRAPFPYAQQSISKAVHVVRKIPMMTNGCIQHMIRKTVGKDVQGEAHVGQKMFLCSKDKYFENGDPREIVLKWVG